MQNRYSFSQCLTGQQRISNVKILRNNTRNILQRCKKDVPPALSIQKNQINVCVVLSLNRDVINVKHLMLQQGCLLYDRKRRRMTLGCLINEVHCIMSGKKQKQKQKEKKTEQN